MTATRIQIRRNDWIQASMSLNAATRFSRRTSFGAGEQRPKIVLFGAQAIPRTHTGKVQRRKLQPLFEAHAACRGPTQLLSLEPR